MENLVGFLSFIAFANACFTNFIFFCLGSPERQLGVIHRERIFSAIGVKLYILYKRYGERNPERLNIFKVFMCPYCFNVYPCTFFYFAFFDYSFSFFFLIILWPLTVGFSHVFLSLIKNATK